jgi:hypothetical protein
MIVLPNKFLPKMTTKSNRIAAKRRPVAEERAVVLDCALDPAQAG